MATFDQRKNFAYSTVLTAPSPATSGPSLVVQSADGTKFPTVSFNAVVWPAGGQPTTTNAEIVRVTAIATDTFTITRAQEGTSARAIVVGDQIAAGVTDKTLDDIEGLFPAGTVVGTTDTQTVSSKTLSDTFMGKVFDTQVTKRDTTLEASTDYLVNDVLENSASYVLELPATSTLEVVPIVKQTEVQSYFGIYDFIESGCVWSGDSYASTLNATMTDGYVWIGGRRLRVNAVRSRAFTASKDTYVDFSDNGDGTAKVTYTENTNNAAAGSPTLAQGSLRNAVIVSGASAIAAATSVNQGQETMILPIVSSVAYSVTDSLGNLICPRDPNRRLLGYRQITSNATTGSTTVVQVTGLTCPIIAPTNRKIKCTIFTGGLSNNTGGDGSQMSIWDGAVSTGTQLVNTNVFPSATIALNVGTIAEAITTPATTTKTYNGGFNAVTGGTTTFTAAATNAGFIKVELV